MVIDLLKKRGIATIMASGDRQGVVEEVSRELGIDEVYWAHSPLDKANLVERLVHEGRKVCTMYVLAHGL